MNHERCSFEELGDLLGVLANRSRLQILIGVLKDECNVSRIQTKLGLPQSTVSRHLALLRRTGLVKPRREGLRICYSVIDPLVKTLLDILGLDEDSSPEKMEHACRLLRGLSNPTRLRILSGLISNECNVKGIQENLGIPQSTASQHLAVLKNLGVVSPDRRESRTCYLVTHPGVKRIIGIVR